MARNYIFWVDVDDVNLLTINEIKTMFGAVKGDRKKEIVDSLISEIKPIIGNRIVLEKWDVDYKTQEFKEYPNFEYNTTEKLKNICDYSVIEKDSTIYFKKKEYADEYVDWMNARGKEVKMHYCYGEYKR